MKILVPVKRVIDANISVRVRADGSGVETENVKMAMNPFCEVALEEALRIREKSMAEQVLLVSVGPEKAQETLRTGLAMGADRAILVKSAAEQAEQLEPLMVAKILHAIALKESVSLILMGKQAIDGDNNQTGQMLAGISGWALASFCSRLALDEGSKKLTATREVDGGLQILELDLPAVVTVDLRLNEPRYASLPNIMKARQKTIESLEPQDLGVDTQPRTKILEVVPPKARKSGVKLASVAELVDKLRNEAKVV